MKIQRRIEVVQGFGLLGLLLLLTGSLATAAIIPPNRVTTWRGNVGIEGGIPQVTTIFTTLPAGSTVAQINSAIQACPSNQVVLLAAGTYTIDGVINLGKSGVVLRGAGMDRTILNVVGSAGIRVRGSPAYDNRSVTDNTPDHLASWTGGYAQGSTTISLSTVAGLQIGTMIVLDQLNLGPDVDSTGCSVTGRGCSRAQSQWARVVAINGLNVTLSSPIAMPNYAASQNPQAWWMDGAIPRRIGIEDMTLNAATGGFDLDGFDTTIGIANAYEVWVKGVKSLYGGGTQHIFIIGAARCEVRRCHLEGNKGGGSLSYGVTPSSGSGQWVEDCIFYGVTAPIVPGWYNGFSAYSYNFATNNPYVGYQDQFVVTHDAHNNMLLVEGNYANGFHGDFYHGSMGYTTLYRNRFTGYDRGIANNGWCVFLGPKNRNCSIVGNVLGKPGWTLSYISGGNRQIYGFGYGGQYGVADDPVVAQSVFLHGNYDVINNSVLWSATNSDRTMPASLLYNSKPAWFGNRPWPPFEPTNGAAIAATDATIPNIPAGYRWVFGIDPPPGSGNADPIAIADGNPKLGLRPLAVNFSSAGSFDPEGAPLRYTWAFGDGGTATNANPSHTYSADGTYIATLTVSDGTNSNTSSDIQIRVGNQPPVVAANANILFGPPPLAVTFSSAGTSDPEGQPLTYSWDFGDGGTSTAANPSHTYLSLGTYKARLTVSDGNSSTTSSDINIAVNRGLVLAFGFEEDSGATATDASGNNLTGTLVNTPTRITTGKFGRALEFNGTSSYVNVPYSPALDVTTAITIMAWCYPTTLNNTYRNIVWRQQDIYFLEGCTPGNLPRFSGTFASGNLDAPSPLPLNQWTHMAGTYDGTTMRFYINGVQVASRAQTGPIATSAGPLGIGGNSLNGQYWPGRIDEVRVYNRALTAAEISADMNTPVGSVNVPPGIPVEFQIDPAGN